MSEKIDITPTWAGLVHGMLDAYAESRNQALRIEFTRMAEAADKWNEHVRNSSKLNRRLESINIHGGLLNHLHSAHIYTIAELIAYDRDTLRKTVGYTSAASAEAILAIHNLKLRSTP